MRNSITHRFPGGLKIEMDLSAPPSWGTLWAGSKMASSVWRMWFREAGAMLAKRRLPRPSTVSRNVASALKREIESATIWEKFDGCSGWTLVDAQTAASEGWNIWDCDGSEHGPYRIERCDGMALFPDDLDAWRHVWARAESGSELHKRALAFVKQHNPIEWKLIADAMGQPS